MGFLLLVGVFVHRTADPGTPTWSSRLGAEVGERRMGSKLSPRRAGAGEVEYRSPGGGWHSRAAVQAALQEAAGFQAGKFASQFLRGQAARADPVQPAS